MDGCSSPQYGEDLIIGFVMFCPSSMKVGYPQFSMYLFVPFGF